MLTQMAESHIVYPGDLAGEIESAAERQGLSVSAFYKEAARRQLQADIVEDENNG